MQRLGRSPLRRMLPRVSDLSGGNKLAARLEKDLHLKPVAPRETEEASSRESRGSSAAAGVRVAAAAADGPKGACDGAFGGELQLRTLFSGQDQDFDQDFDMPLSARSGAGCTAALVADADFTKRQAPATLPAAVRDAAPLRAAVHEDVRRCPGSPSAGDDDEHPVIVFATPVLDMVKTSSEVSASTSTRRRAPRGGAVPPLSERPRLSVLVRGS
jgi:hypothetical protein